jgi:pimeloyl-ACP methyl ester carboxylesterase
MPALLPLGWLDMGKEAYGPDEEGWWEHNNRILTSPGSSHGAVHTREPQTLAAALNDSPAGLAAWIWGVRRRGTDLTDGDMESVYTKEDLCTLASIFWFTQTIGTSMRYYWDTWGPVERGPLARGVTELVHDRTPLLEAPTAIAVFPHEVRPPRSAAEKATNLKRWTVMPRGGHYAPYEVPELWYHDVQEFFRDFR